MTGPELAGLLQEASFGEWESLQSALKRADGQPPPRVGWLVTHLSVTKREYWKLVRGALGTPSPPPELDLAGLCRWELETTSGLEAGQLDTMLLHSGRALTVAGLLRLNARHTVWHAGQIAALCSGPRLA